VSTGIEARHTRACPSHKRNGGGRCTCKPSYQASVWDKRAGKPIKRTFTTKAAAKLWREDALVAVRGGTIAADRGPTLNAALDDWVELLRAGGERTRSGDPYKPGTIRDYERCIRRFGFREALGHYRVRELRTTDAQRWVDDMVRSEKMKPATIDAAVTPLKAFYRRAIIRGDATTNPFVGIMKPAVRCKVREGVSPVLAAAMLEVLPVEDRRVWAIAFYAGLRRGEIIGLDPARDVDLAAGVIHVRRGWDMIDGEVEPKSRKGKRKVPIPALLRDYLDAIDGPLGEPNWIARTNVRAARAWTAAGLPTITLHEARHTYASFMNAAGVNAKALSTFMGHATIAVTLDLYGHLFPGSEDEAATLLDAYLARSAEPARIAV
jgi:integrase